MCVCSHRYPACNVHASYCHLWPVRLYIIFPHYVINGKIFETKILDLKCVFFLFSLQLLSETFLILRRTDQDKIKNIYWYFVKYPLFLSDFNERLIFSSEFREILKKISNFMENRSLRATLFHVDLRTDWRTDMTELIFAFRNFAKARKWCTGLNLRKLFSYVEKTIRWM